jgi:hypothetical protein
VQRYGHAGVQWLAVMAGGDQVEWQQELLLHVANKMVVGCDPAVWGTALPGATRLVLVSGRPCCDLLGSAQHASLHQVCPCSEFTPLVNKLPQCACRYILFLIFTLYLGLL